jgi:hypothetical protein
VRTFLFSLLSSGWPGRRLAPVSRAPARRCLRRKGLLPQWPEKGPTLLWTWSNAASATAGPPSWAGRYYTIGGRGESEFLVALDIDKVKDGAPAEAWAVRVGPLFDFKTNNWSSGPSSTPSVDGDAVYALGGNGDLVCVAAADGKERWRLHLPSQLEAEVNPIGGGPANSAGALPGRRSWTAAI